MQARHPHPLRVARRRKNLTIEQLAEVAKVGASTVWRAEHAYPINAESRHRLCTVLGMTSEELGLVVDSREKGMDSSEPADWSSGETSAPMLSKTTDFPRVFHREPGDNIQQAGPRSEQSIGVWLACAGSDLASLFDAGWTLEAVLNALRVVLQGVQGMPVPVRHVIFQAAGAALKREVPLSAGAHLSLEERERLYNALEKSVAQGWQLFHTARPEQVLVVAQAQLFLLQQAHTFIEHDLRCGLYAALYDLIGAALLFQGHTAEAQRAFEKAYIAALEGGHAWNMAQSQNWQGIVANGTGRYAEAICSIEASLRLLAHKRNEEDARLQAHLLANWAYNASLLRDQSSVQEKLEASAALLEHLGPHEEFDQARWHQMTGSCLLLFGKYQAAIVHLEQALARLPSEWLARRLLTLLPLADAYARLHERDASIAVAEQMTALLPVLDSKMLNQRFAEYQHVLSKTFPRDAQVRAFLAGARQRLLHAADEIGCK
jgi:tetratricopeptide (TPR) repeat protein/transcriptional regulator with XRE-family HTH domain